jgi:hypothetical protein
VCSAQFALAAEIIALVADGQVSRGEVERRKQLAR